MFKLNFRRQTIVFFFQIYFMKKRLWARQFGNILKLLLQQEVHHSDPHPGFSRAHSTTAMDRRTVFALTSSATMIRSEFNCSITLGQFIIKNSFFFVIVKRSNFLVLYTDHGRPPNARLQSRPESRRLPQRRSGSGDQIWFWIVKFNQSWKKQWFSTMS